MDISTKSNITTQRVSQVRIPTTKLERALFDRHKNHVFYESTSVSVKTGNSRHPTEKVVVQVDFNGMKSIGATVKDGDRLNPFDREVHDVVANLCAVNTDGYVTPKMILRVLAGNIDDLKITDKMRSAILESLSKMRNTQIEIKATDKAGVPYTRKFFFSGSLLPSVPVPEVILNNTLVKDVVQIQGKLPLFEYADQINQVTAVDVGLRAVPTLRHTPTNFELMGYLLREIFWMKHLHSKRRRVILYETLLNFLEIDAMAHTDAGRHRCADIRLRVRHCLEFWKTKFIKDFVEETEHGRVTRVCIHL